MKYIVVEYSVYMCGQPKSHHRGMQHTGGCARTDCKRFRVARREVSRADVIDLQAERARRRR